MKADPAVQRRLLDLADIDAELNRLAHRRRTLPEHTELTAAETAVRAAKDALVEVETRAGDLDRDIRRLERDVEAVRSRADRDQKILAGSGVGAKQATDLQHELETLARRQSVLEDEELEIMEQREAVGMDVQHAQRTLDEAQVHQVSSRSGATPRWPTSTPARPGGAATVRRSSRTSPRTCSPCTSGGGPAAAPAPPRCGSAAAARAGWSWTGRRLAALQGAPADEVVYCEECGTVLLRTPGRAL